MPKFTATDVFEPIEYDFRPHVDAAGTVPEPSDGTILEFQEGMNALLEREGVNMVGPDEDDAATGTAGSIGVGTKRLLEQLARRPSLEHNRKVRDEVIALHADLCGQRPSTEQLKALPYRLQEAFMGYVQENLLDPEVLRGATRA